MSRRIASLVVLISLIVMSLFSITTDKSKQEQSDKRNQTFAWFNTLGYPDVSFRPFVKVATGGYTQEGDEPPNPHYQYGFLVEEQGRMFRVLSLNLQPCSYEFTTTETPRHEQVGFERLELSSWAANYLKELQDLAGAKKLDHMRRFGERLAERSEVFVVAWACWLQGENRLSQKLYEHAITMDEQRRDDDVPGKSFQQYLASDLAHAEMWRIILSFGDTSVPRNVLLERCERFMAHFPESEHYQRARETAAQLRQLTAEDSAHEIEVGSRKPFEQLTKSEQIAELIFQLRDQNGHQWSQPGSCDVFATGSHKDDSPAHRLLTFGYDAVPALIEVLEDKRLTRSVGYHRGFYFSHHVLHVGDCAEQILSRIAGRHFYEGTYTNAAMIKDGEARSTKAEIQAWYAELKKKGEKSILVESVQRGDRNSVQQAERLIKNYPESAMPVIIQGIKATKDSWIRSELVEKTALLPGDVPIAFLIQEMQSGPTVGSRLLAASSLLSRRKTEAIEAMIAEWKRKGSSPIGQTNDDNHEESLGGVAAFLASLDNEAAIKALADNLRERPLSLRTVVISALGNPKRNHHFVSFDTTGIDPIELRQRSASVKDAIEKLLLAELDDSAGTASLSGTWEDKHFRDPRLCDLAGHILSQLSPEKYSFDLSASLAKRDQSLIGLKNVDRRARGLQQLPVPVLKAIQRISDGDLQPMFEAMLRGDKQQRLKASQEIEKMGLGALPAVQKQLDQGEIPPEQHAQFEKLSQRLSCIVKHITVAKDSLNLDERVARQLETMKDKPLEPSQIIRLVGAWIEQLPEGARAFRVRVIRPGDGTGCTLEVDLLNKIRSDKMSDNGGSATPGEYSPKDKPFCWTYSERVSVGNHDLRHSFGTGTPYQRDDRSSDLEDAMVKACASKTKQPIDIHIQVKSMWANGQQGNRNQ